MKKKTTFTSRYVPASNIFFIYPYNIFFFFPKWPTIIKRRTAGKSLDVLASKFFFSNCSLLNRIYIYFFFPRSFQNYFSGTNNAYKLNTITNVIYIYNNNSIPTGAGSCNVRPTPVIVYKPGVCNPCIPAARTL